MSQEFSLGEPVTPPPAETTAGTEWLVTAEPSEDASHLLPPLDVCEETKPGDYSPRPWLEYVLDLVGPEPCPRSHLLSILDERVLRELGGPELYGRALGESTWTFVRAEGVPEAFDELALGWNLAPREQEAPDVRTLRRYRDLVAHRLRPLGRRPKARELPERAAERGAELIRLRDNWDVGVALVLRAPWLKRFDSRVIWDAAAALGMRWGHLDIFHWHNRPGCSGDERLFSLWSLEAPGTFLPEHVAAGLSVPEIALGFSIPRSPDPLGVFDRMVAAARYFQARLGGKLLIGPVAIASEQQVLLWRVRVRTAADELTAAGFPPGSARTMQLF
jgi:hypothetical protein